MKLARYTPDDTSTYSGSSSADASSSSPALTTPLYPMSTLSYPDSTPSTSLWTSYTLYQAPTSTYIPVASPSEPLQPPTTTRNGPAAVSETTLFTGISSSDGYLSTLSSLSPFLASTASANTSNSTGTNRTALIAALAAGLSALVLLLLVAFLLYRRRRRRREQPLEPGSRALPHSALLRDDEMAHTAHIRAAPVTMAQYENSGVGGGAAATYYRPPSPSLSMLRTRVSETGSIFREEVWPPPSPTIDPIQMRSSQVDLSRIVDDVMGPTNDQNDGGPISETWKGHKRGLTESSTTPLLFERQTSSGHGSSEDFTHPYAYASPSSLYSPTFPISPPMVDQPDVPTYGPLPVFSPQTNQSRSSVTSVSSSLHSRPAPAGQSPSSFRPPSVGSIHGSIASSATHQGTQPKVSSPLVRALTGFGVSNGRQSPLPR